MASSRSGATYSPWYIHKQIIDSWDFSSSSFRNSHSHHFDYSATFMCYLCFHTTICQAFSHWKVNMGPLKHKTITVCALHTKVSHTLMGLHNCRLGRREKQSFTLSRPGVKPTVAAFIESLAQHADRCTTALSQPQRLHQGEIQVMKSHV